MNIILYNIQMIVQMFYYSNNGKTIKNMVNKWLINDAKHR